MKNKQIIILIVLSLNLWFPASAQIRILTIGDSTMAEYDVEKRSGENEMRGWVQMLALFLSNDIELINRAKNGRSSKSFYNEIWVARLRETLIPGDYVFIQFGHNDEKADGKDTEGVSLDKRGTAAWGQYQEYLRKYIEETRQKGAIPILFTPIVRCLMDTATNTISDIGMHNLTHLTTNATTNNYPEAMRALAIEMDVPLIDMTLLTKKIVEDYGVEKSRQILYAKNDNTHLRAMGGFQFADLAVKELKRQHILSDYLNTSQQLTVTTKVSGPDNYEIIHMPYDKGRKIQINWSPTNNVIKTKDYQIETAFKLLDTITGNGKMLINIAGGQWPSGDIDMDASRYVELKLTAKNDLYISEVQISIASVGEHDMFFTALASADESFQKVYDIATMAKLKDEEPVTYQSTSVIKIEKGKPLYIRIYPWSKTASANKYLRIEDVRITGLILK